MLPTDLAGRSILIVEDDWFIASYIESGVSQAGGTPIGPFATNADALATLDRAPSIAAATLNIDLDDGPSWPIAQALARRAIPFVFISARVGSSLPAPFGDRPIVAKPFATHQVVAVLTDLIAATRERSA